MKIFKKIFFTYIWMRSLFILGGSEQWSWTYTTELAPAYKVDAKQEYLITQSIKPSTQLIFSWNAYRPKKGYFSFWIQGKEWSKDQKKPGIWSSWHKMMEWGASVQRSFESNLGINAKPDTIGHHEHVRFEARNGKKFSAFRIKIVPHQHAPLKYMKSITVSCSDFTKFKSEQVSSLRDLPTVRILGAPRKSQFMINHEDNYRLCSPTSCSMLVETVSKKICDPYTFAQKVYDDGLNAYGSWPFNTAYAFEKSGGTHQYAVVRYNSFRDIHAQLTKGFPVVVSVRGYIKGAPKSYDNGHLLMIVGFDARKQRVICHDPAGKYKSTTLKLYPVASFLTAWELSKRLVYEVTKRAPGCVI